MWGDGLMRQEIQLLKDNEWSPLIQFRNWLNNLSLDLSRSDLNSIQTWIKIRKPEICTFHWFALEIKTFESLCYPFLKFSSKSACLFFHTSTVSEIWGYCTLPCPRFDAIKLQSAFKIHCSLLNICYCACFLSVLLSCLSFMSEAKTEETMSRTDEASIKHSLENWDQSIGSRVYEVKGSVTLNEILLKWQREQHRASIFDQS